MGREKQLPHKWVGKKNEGLLNMYIFFFRERPNSLDLSNSPKARPRESIHEIRVAGRGKRQIQRIWTFGFAIDGSGKKSCLSFRFRKILFPLPRRGRGKKHVNRKNGRPLRFQRNLRGPGIGGDVPLPSKIACDFRRQRSGPPKIL